MLRLWHGISFTAWLRVLVANRFAVDTRCLLTATTITVSSLANSALGVIQRLFYGRRINRVEIEEDPVFIIGHWRTGTTMMHELMSLDRRHRVPTTYECLVPNHFIISRHWLPRRIRSMLPSKRPMDNMRVGLGKPQEDEVALLLRGVPSTFISVAFPRTGKRYSRFMDLESLNSKEYDDWKSAFLRFLRELLFVRRGRLVLKSPHHTARVKTILTMFPRARFIHLVRDPYDLYPSTVRFWTRMQAEHGLQRVQESQLHDEVVSNLERMYESFDAAKDRIGDDRLVLVRFEDLTADPVESMRAVYAKFGWTHFADVQPDIERYAHRAEHYQRNTHELTPLQVEEIGIRWGWYARRFGYELRQKSHQLSTG